MKLQATASIAVAALPLVLADWQFKSRSDLAPPRLNITIPAASDTESGYLFVAPFAGFPDTSGEQHGPRQAAPYIFRENGDLIWSGYSYYSIWATNFQKGKLKGKDVLFSFEGDHSKWNDATFQLVEILIISQMRGMATVMVTQPSSINIMRPSENYVQVITSSRTSMSSTSSMKRLV